MKSTCRVVAVAVLLAGVAVAIRPAGAQVSAEKLPQVEQIDSTATSYLFRMSWPEIRKRIAGTPALAVIEDPEIQAFFNEVQRVANRPGPYSKPVATLIEGMHQQLVISSVPAGDGEHARKVLVTLDPTRKAAFTKLYNAMLAVVPPDGVEIDGQKFVGSEAFAMSLKDDTLTLLVTPEDATPTLKRSSPQALAQSEQFKTTVGKVLAGQKELPIAMFYHDLRPTWAAMDAEPASKAAWDQMSWRSIRSLAGATFVENKLYRNRYRLELSEPRTGLFKHTQAGRINAEWLKRVPADASGFMTGYWDGRSLALTLPAVATAAAGEPEDLADIAGSMEPFAKLLETIGPRYLVYRQPGRFSGMFYGGMIPLDGTVVVAELPSKAKFDQALAQLKQMGPLGQMLKPQTLNGRPVIVVNLMAVSLCLAQMDDVVLVTMNPQLLKDAMDNWQRPGRSIIETDAYKKAAANVPADAHFQLYIAPGGFARGYFDQYVGLGQQGLMMLTGMQRMWDESSPSRPELEGLNPLLMPRGRAIARHVTDGTILWGVDDGKGITFDGTAPVLCTPYYWVTGYALLKVPPEPQLMLQLIPHMAAPAEATPTNTGPADLDRPAPPGRVPPPPPTDF